MKNQSLRQSELFTKTKRAISQEETSINASLLLRAGFIDRLMAGVYSYLPLGLRVLNNIENITREEMARVGGQEILMPALQPREPWDKTDRWNTIDVLYKFKGQENSDMLLAPTHEETVTPLVGSTILSHKDLPRYVYQIQTKFRNEKRAKSGLLRGREFRMKDLYSFHANNADLDEYYEKVKEAYTRIYQRCGIGATTYLTYASGGAFSQYSHEYQMLCEHGEDIIYLWREKNVAVNREIMEDIKQNPEWAGATFEEHKAIEVGNIFKLGTRFSDSFKLEYQDSHDQRLPIIMGCYGLGTSRLVGAIAEVHHDERGLKWPREVAPFDLHLVSILPNEEAQKKAEELYEILNAKGYSMLYDDRVVSAGEKFSDADLIGLPIRVLVSAKTLKTNSVEIKVRGKEQAILVPIEEFLSAPEAQMLENS